MSDEITKDRSPRAPGITLQDAIEISRKLYGQARNAALKPEIAAKALGYSGLNGAALAILATLSQYGLVDRSKGMVAVTPLAVRILHPISDDQCAKAIKDAATAPSIFTGLLNGFEERSPEVVAGHLIQNGFNPDRAKKVAGVYAANRAFAKLEVVRNTPLEETEERITEPQSSPVMGFSHSFPQPQQAVETAPPAVKLPESHKMLAQYTIPLGANQATLVFTGEALTPDDFDALIDFVSFSKRQFERATKMRPAGPAEQTPVSIALDLKNPYAIDAATKESKGDPGLS